MSRSIPLYDLGRVPYRAALAFQHRAVELRSRGEAPDVLYAFEHEPVLTVGRSGHDENLRAGTAELARRGIEVVPVERGGDVTYHGPGQIVGYPIVSLDGLPGGRDLHRFLRDIEQALIESLGAFGIRADRKPPYTGVWVGEEKVAAIGVAVRRWVSFHGFALNVDPDLSHFDLIHPCGIRDLGVASIRSLTGQAPSREAVLAELAAAFSRVWERPVLFPLRSNRRPTSRSHRRPRMSETKAAASPKPTRTEKDSLGPLEVPADAYYGVQTARAVANFPISGERLHMEMVRAVTRIKIAAARANAELGVLDRKKADAIVAAAEEILAGKHDNQFVVDAYQAGAGTSFHMNVNEVIANRACELMGGKKGDHALVHPNDHVNMAQSTNDVIPTAMRLAAHALAGPLTQEMAALAASLDRKAQEFVEILEVGPDAFTGRRPDHAGPGILGLSRLRAGLAGVAGAKPRRAFGAGTRRERSRHRDQRTPEVSRAGGGGAGQGDRDAVPLRPQSLRGDAEHGALRPASRTISAVSAWTSRGSRTT